MDYKELIGKYRVTADRWELYWLEMARTGEGR